MKKELRAFLVLALVFFAAYFIPFSRLGIQNAIIEAFLLVQEYARLHVLLCLVPAFFIAGAISVFVSKESVMRYLGPRAPKVLSYGVASVSGTILAVCSCTVLPLFAGIYTRGAGIGPATAFLYSGPAINVLAIIMTARVLGWKIGLARAVGAVAFSIIIGLIMHALFQKGEDAKNGESGFESSAEQRETRPLWKTALYFATMVGILVFMNWSKGDASLPASQAVHGAKWVISGALAALLAWMLIRWFNREELKEWAFSTWVFAKQIFPLLLGGVFLSGFLLGRPGHDGIIPGRWIAGLLGGNGIGANMFASFAGALMYFATLTEVPILQGLIGSGMGQGPALALLLAGPALSLPSMIIIRGILGTKKAMTYFLLVIVMAALTGLVFGAVVG